MARQASRAPFKLSNEPFRKPRRYLGARRRLLFDKKVGLGQSPRIRAYTGKDLYKEKTEDAALIFSVYKLHCKKLKLNVSPFKKDGLGGSSVEEVSKY